MGEEKVSLSLRKKIMMLVIAAVALVPFGWEPAQSMVCRPKIEESLYELVKMSGAQPVEVNIQGWTKVNNQFISLEELQQLARKTAKKLGNPNPQVVSEGGGDFRQVRIQSAMGDNSVLSLAAQSLINYGQPDNQGETYITVSIVQGVKDRSSRLSSEAVKGALFSPFGEKPQVLTNIVASLPGKLSAAEQEQLLSRLFAAAEAKRIDGINTEQLYSVTGFTPAIKDRLEIGENQVNLNIAVRYHNEDGRTYIYIGSPLLIGEY